jgi:hypothetical protein
MPRKGQSLLDEKEQRPWYENALLLTVAGSIIVVTGQLAGTVIPIIWGPEDISDFSINLDRTFSIVEVQPRLTSIDKISSSAGPVNVTIEDLHSVLRPYRFNVNLQAFSDVSGIYVSFRNPKTREVTQEAKAGETLYVGIFTNITKPGYYPIKFQGTGSGERKRNATFYLWVTSHEDYLRSKAKNGSLRLPMLQMH